MIKHASIIVLFVIAFYSMSIMAAAPFARVSALTAAQTFLSRKAKTSSCSITNWPSKPGVNPLQFASLEDYKEFMDWQRSQGIKCPVLYVQQSYDAQGNEIFQQRPDPMDPQGGLGMMPPAQDAALNPTQDMTLLFDAGRVTHLTIRTAIPALIHRTNILANSRRWIIWM